MKFVADKHFPSAAARILVQAGFEVLEICRFHSSSSDPQVLDVCMASSATLLTMDKGFGTLTFRDRLPANGGIILFRLEGTERQEFCRLVLEAVQSEDSWEGAFAVVSADKIRKRPLHEELPPS